MAVSCCVFIFLLLFLLMYFVGIVCVFVCLFVGVFVVAVFLLSLLFWLSATCISPGVSYW